MTIDICIQIWHTEFIQKIGYTDQKIAGGEFSKTLLRIQRKKNGLGGGSARFA
jgi:hypothetical protein